MSPTHGGAEHQQRSGETRRLATSLATTLAALLRELELGALGGTRTPNLLIRSQMLYPLSYERTNQQYTAVRALTARVGDPCGRTGVIKHLIF
jgi:hypothetical protein